MTSSTCTAPTTIARGDNMPFRVTLDVTTIDTFMPIAPHAPAHEHRCVVVEEGVTVDAREVHRPGWPRLRESATDSIMHLTIDNGGAPPFCDQHKYVAELREWIRYRQKQQRIGTLTATLFGVLDVEYPPELRGPWGFRHRGREVVPDLYRALGVQNEIVMQALHDSRSHELYYHALEALKTQFGFAGVYGTPFSGTGFVANSINTLSSAWFPVAHAQQGEPYIRAFRRTIAAAVKRRDRERPGRPVLPLICPVNESAPEGTDCAPYIRAAYKSGCDGLVIFGRVPRVGDAGYLASMEFHTRLIEEDIPAVMAELEAARLAALPGAGAAEGSNG